MNIEGEVALFIPKRWDRRNRADLIESATPCHDAPVAGPYGDSNPLLLTQGCHLADLTAKFLDSGCFLKPLPVKE